MSVSSTVLLSAGTLLLVHAAYSLQHYRSLLQDLEESTIIENSDPLPMDVWIEMGMGFGAILISELTRNNLKPIKQASQQPMSAAAFVTRDFDIYTSRARGFKKES